MAYDNRFCPQPPIYIMSGIRQKPPMRQFFSLSLPPGKKPDHIRAMELLLTTRISSNYCLPMPIGHSSFNDSEPVNRHKNFR